MTRWKSHDQHLELQAQQLHQGLTPRQGVIRPTASPAAAAILTSSLDRTQMNNLRGVKGLSF
jgi:hypothetical protein